MDVKQTAKFLNQSTDTIYRKLRKGEIPGARKFGTWKIHRKYLEESFKGGNNQ